jgi:plasmid stabilization system protein ParE
VDDITKYNIIYTESALNDIVEKADYIANALHDSKLALSWYTSLRENIQNDLSFFPKKYQLYDISPWKEKEIRQFLTRNDVVLYSVDEENLAVYVYAVVTRGRDLTLL